MFENDPISGCIDVIKSTVYTMYDILSKERATLPFWQFKQRWVLNGSTAALLLVLENLIKVQAEYKTRRIKNEPYEDKDAGR